MGEVKEINDRVSSYEVNFKNAKNDMGILVQQISKSKAKLVSITKVREAEVKQENETKERINYCQQRITELYDKQGRKDQFKNKKERDKYLKNRLKEVKNNLNAEEKHLKKVKDQNKMIEKKLKD